MSMPSQQFGKQEELGVPPPARSAPAKSEERVAYLFLMPWFAGLLLFLAVPTSSPRTSTRSWQRTLSS